MGAVGDRESHETAQSIQKCSDLEVVYFSKGNFEMLFKRRKFIQLNHGVGVVVGETVEARQIALGTVVINPQCRSTSSGTIRIGDPLEPRTENSSDIVHLKV